MFNTLVNQYGFRLITVKGEIDVVFYNYEYDKGVYTLDTDIGKVTLDGTKLITEDSTYPITEDNVKEIVTNMKKVLDNKGKITGDLDGLPYFLTTASKYVIKDNVIAEVTDAITLPNKDITMLDKYGDVYNFQEHKYEVSIIKDDSKTLSGIVNKGYVRSLSYLAVGKKLIIMMSDTISVFDIDWDGVTQCFYVNGLELAFTDTLYINGSDTGIKTVSLELTDTYVATVLDKLYLYSCGSLHSTTISGQEFRTIKFLSNEKLVELEELVNEHYVFYIGE